MTNNVTRSQAEGLQFLSDYRSAFTTRADGSTWPKNERTWLNAGRYFRGLLRPGSTNTITDIAETMHTDQERLERFVRESPWEHESVTAELRERVPEAIQGQEAALIVDGMGIPKTGTDSVDVARQWCGVTGKLDNCQVTVNCTLARPGERQNADQRTWSLGMRLFLSEKWTDDDEADYENQQEREYYAQRRKDTAVPAAIEHQSKLEIALELLEQAGSTEIEHGWLLLIDTSVKPGVSDGNSGRFLSPMSWQCRRRSSEPFLRTPSLSSQTLIPIGSTPLILKM